MMVEDHSILASGTTPLATNIILVFLSIAFYNSIELTFITFGTFKRHAGLYFWSFLIATWGISVYGIGFCIKYFCSSSLRFVYATFISVGWVCMVSGQSMVLWSRLHLVLYNQFRLKCVLVMVIVNGIVMHCATIPMIYGSSLEDPTPWLTPYSIQEKIQVTFFFLQEVIISFFYIVETIKLMKLGGSVGNGRKPRRLMNHLIYVNTFIILLDATILGLEYADLYMYQTSYKAFVYSTKLKLEFTILNRLVEMTTGKKDISSQGTRSRTANKSHSRGIALETFMSNTENKIPQDISYQAYATGGGERSGGLSDEFSCRRSEDLRCTRNNVVTTEIVVRSEERDVDQDSITGKSMCTSTMEEGGKSRDTGNLSRSSSELHLAP